MNKPLQARGAKYNPSAPTISQRVSAAGSAIKNAIGAVKKNMNKGMLTPPAARGTYPAGEALRRSLKNSGSNYDEVSKNLRTNKEKGITSNGVGVGY